MSLCHGFGYETVAYHVLGHRARRNVLRELFLFWSVANNCDLPGFENTGLKPAQQMQHLFDSGGEQVTLGRLAEAIPVAIKRWPACSDRG